MTATRSSAAVRARLDHPVIDADGHFLEFLPVYLDFLKEVGGPGLVRRYVARSKRRPGARWYAADPATRRAQRLPRPPFWAVPAAQSLDRATAMLPRLMRERLDEFGIDFCIAYPTLGFFLFDEPDDELRQAGCRAQNAMVAELFGDVGDRITPAATIPAFTPSEAIAELDHAVGTLGLKAAMVASLVLRPAPRGGRDGPWLDPLALDSAHDYDPLWARCVALGVAPTAHSFMQGHGWRRAPSSYIYNQTGHFADAGEAFAKALFLGGVTRRFPDLRVGILEGGVGWAVALFATLVEVWEKRGMPGIRDLDPAALDLDLLAACFERYGGSRFAGRASIGADGAAHDADRALLDEFAAAAVARPEDVVARFARPLWFGCEADDALVPVALDGRGLPLDTPLQAMLGSDIGHWDVHVMADVLAEAHAKVDRGLVTPGQFRAFTFANAARLHAGMNPAFFKGTSVEDAVARLMAEAPAD
jgi:predicted TIM-barrel fold metal-dependent hydrolase